MWKPLHTVYFTCWWAEQVHLRYKVIQCTTHACWKAVRVKYGEKCSALCVWKIEFSDSSTVHSEKDGFLAFGHKWVKRWVFLEFFLQSLMESSSNYVSEVYFSKKQAIARIEFRPGFAPRALNLENPSKSRPFGPACNSALYGSNPSSGTLFGPFFKFQISQHCTLYDKILKNRLIRKLARARAHLFVNGL